MVAHLISQKMNRQPEERSTGSNGFAIGPSKSASGKAMLYINPHVSPYFRPEVHMVSESGLNAYGAVTWGQFFIYQGFNSFCGWMHTSSYVDAADTYIEKITPAGNGFTYLYDGKQLPLKKKPITIPYTNGQVNGKKYDRCLLYQAWTDYGPAQWPGFKYACR